MEKKRKHAFIAMIKEVNRRDALMRHEGYSHVGKFCRGRVCRILREPDRFGGRPFPLVAVNRISGRHALVLSAVFEALRFNMFLCRGSGLGRHGWVSLRGLLGQDRAKRARRFLASVGGRHCERRSWNSVMMI